MGDNILVVDDDPDICEIVSMALSKKGYAIRTAMSGEQGITVARERLPDIVLLDNTLPDMEGKEVARHIKKIAGDRRIAIIMMTGKDVPKGEIDATLYAGCLKKPFRLADMVEYVERVSKEPGRSFDLAGTDHYYTPGP